MGIFDILNKRKFEETGCKGHSVRYGEYTEYECEYEFSGEVDCGNCVFGGHGGKQDPRINPED